MKNIVTEKEFNELVWNYGASGDKTIKDYSDDCQSVICEAWNFVKDDVEDSSTDSTKEIDEQINSFYDQFLQYYILANISNPYESDGDISGWLFYTAIEAKNGGYKDMNEIQKELNEHYAKEHEANE